MIEEIQYWHAHQGEGEVCEKVLAGGMICGAQREQHPEVDWNDHTDIVIDFGYTLKLDLTPSEHNALVEWLKRGSYNPAIKGILDQIIGYDNAVEAVKSDHEK